MCDPDGTEAPAPERRRLEIEGSVQGVGFRPFVYRLAGELRLSGWVINDVRGVVIEAQGECGALDRFELGAGGVVRNHD